MGRPLIVWAVSVFGASLVYFPVIAILTATDEAFPIPVRVALVAIDAYLFGCACFILFTTRGRAQLTRPRRKPRDRRTIRRLWWFYGVVWAAFLLTNAATASDKKLVFLVVLPVVVATVSVGGRLIQRTDSTRARGGVTDAPGSAGPEGGAP